MRYRIDIGYHVDTLFEQLTRCYSIKRAGTKTSAMSLTMCSAKSSLALDGLVIGYTIGRTYIISLLTISRTYIISLLNYLIDDPTLQFSKLCI